MRGIDGAHLSGRRGDGRAGPRTGNGLRVGDASRRVGHDGPRVEAGFMLRTGDGPLAGHAQRTGDAGGLGERAGDGKAALDATAPSAQCCVGEKRRCLREMRGEPGL
jgi:hypothetical protein